MHLAKKRNSKIDNIDNNNGTGPSKNTKKEQDEIDYKIKIQGK